MNRRRSTGVALIQALLVTTLIALLVLQLSLAAQEQVGRARVLLDRAEASLELQSREAELTFELLTRPWAGGAADAAPPPPGVRVEAGAAVEPLRWNFHGEPFEFRGARVRIVDQSGLMPFPAMSDEGFVALLLRLGVDAERARRLGRQLLGRQGAVTVDGGAERTDSLQGYSVPWPIQSIDELRRLPDMDDALYRRLSGLVTDYPAGSFNPATAPAEVLATSLSDTQLSAVLELRRRGELDAGSLWRYAGIQGDDFTVLYPGPALGIEIELERAGVTSSRRSVLVVRPYLDEPVGVWSRR